LDYQLDAVLDFLPFQFGNRCPEAGCPVLQALQNGILDAAERDYSDIAWAIYDIEEVFTSFFPWVACSARRQACQFPAQFAQRFGSDRDGHLPIEPA